MILVGGQQNLRPLSFRGGRFARGHKGFEFKPFGFRQMDAILRNRLTVPRRIWRASGWHGVIVRDAKDRETKGPACGGAARVGAKRIVDG
jgi:hypothetical protein